MSAITLNMNSLNLLIKKTLSDRMIIKWETFYGASKRIISNIKISIQSQRLVKVK